MRIRDSFGVYHVLERRIRSSEKPLTCVDLYDHDDVRQFADSVRRVSDYLGHMYRQGLLSRTPAPKEPNSQARFAYYWKNRDELTLSKLEEPQLPLRTAAPTAPVSVLKRPSIEIRDDGNSITIELPQLVITIIAKPQ